MPIHLFFPSLRQFPVVAVTALLRLTGPALALSLAACGGGSLSIGPFPPIGKTEGDPPFVLVAPTSRSPVAFTFSSSDLNVAIVTGSTVTIPRDGTSTITAQQAGSGTWSPTSASTLLTVAPRACIAPAERINGACVAPQLAGNIVTRGDRSWMPVRFVDTWVNANAYCSKTTINGQTGWRLPGTFEMSDLAASGQLAGQSWILARSWSSAASLDSGKLPVKGAHDTVDLATGAVASQSDLAGAYVACVR